MKNLLLITALISSIATSSFAKTEGNQIGIDILRSTAKHQYNSTLYTEFDNSKIGYGVNYKYAFNVNGLFVAPEIFADKLGTTAQDQDGDSISINHRYGAKLNIGYDATENLALYAGAGAAIVSYEVDWKSLSAKTTGSKMALIYAAGASYEVSKNVALNLEYNIQNLTLATPDLAGINAADTNISTLKLGVAYRF